MYKNRSRTRLSGGEGRGNLYAVTNEIGPRMHGEI